MQEAEKTIEVGHHENGNIAACGKQGKSSKAETNLKAAKKGM